MKKLSFSFILALIFSISTHAQDADSLSQLLNLSIENLMDINIYSASKSQEVAFDAPLSSTVITREQIKRAGCTSIPEALRLVPGVIVREQTNGNYDVHILGLDNVPPNASLIFFGNSTTLVMIDNRPVYNYLHGGTFWETLPIDLNDVEKIEVVIGPCAALYGPNAVSGVINIITRKPEKEGTYASGKAEYGSYNSLIANAAVGYKFNDKVSAWVSGNLQNRDRTQTSYYDVVTNKYVPIDSVAAIKNAALTNPNIASQSYPQPDLAMHKYGINGFVNYTPEEKVHFDLAIGGQYSEVQNEFGTGLTPISTATSDTRYADMKAGIYGFSVQLSYLTGIEKPVLGQQVWQWNLNTTDAVLEYKFDKVKNLIITPGISYRRADYDDGQYVNTAILQGLWNGAAISTTESASMRADYKLLNDKLRLIASCRLDKFNYPDKAYLPYQFAATYKINDNNLFRISEGQAYRAPLLIDVFSNLNLTGPFPLISPSQTYLFELRGNKNIQLLSTNMFSAGYRTKITDKIEADIGGFYSVTKNFSETVFESGKFDSTAPVAFTGLIEIGNLTVQAQEYGGTLSGDFLLDKWQFNAFITVQQTYLLNYSPYLNTPQAPPLPSNNNNPALYNLYSNGGTKINHAGTPTYFGGFYINYQPFKKLNLNVNAYFFGAQTQLESDNLTYNDGQRGIQNISAQLLLNAVASYNLTKKLNIFANFRNILNDNSVEFYRGDAPAFMAFGGACFEL